VENLTSQIMNEPKGSRVENTRRSLEDGESLKETRSLGG